MKKVLMMTLALTLCAGVAMADHIGIYADNTGATCALTTLVTPPGNNSMYIIHKQNVPGSTASQFKVNDASTLFATTQTTPYLALGAWNVDLSLSYGGCVSGDHVLMTLNFLWFGAPINGCTASLEVVPAPTSPIPGAIAYVECDFATTTAASGGRGYVGAQSGTCPGGPCDPLATATTTWGSIKSLYR